MQKIIDAFEKIGSTADIRTENRFREDRGFRITVSDNRRTHFSCFRLAMREGTRLYVPDVNVKEHALLLKVRWKDAKGRVNFEDFLCGRDDHGWFVSTLNGHSFHNVRGAVESLRPEEITRELAKKKVSRSRRNRHHNEVFIRQGEWFFVPMPPDFEPEGIVRKKERLGTKGKPHIADFVCSGGESRYIHPNYRGTLTWERVSELMKYGVTGFRQVFIVQAAFAKGRVVHPDHKTVFLDGWHRVIPNTENRLANSNAFID